MKRVVIVVLALAVVAVVAYFGGQNLTVREAAEPTVTFPSPSRGSRLRMSCRR